MTRLAIIASHPIQYYAPLYRELARHIDLTVFYAHRATPEQQAVAGFGTAFDWDVDLLGGYQHAFLRNVAVDPGAHHFWGCDTPDIGERLATERFDALLSIGWHLKSHWQGIRVAKQQGISVLVRGDSHLDTPRGWIKLWVKRRAYPTLLRVFDAALYVGRRNRDYYEHYRYPTQRLFFSPHCVDTARFAAGATEVARAELRSRLGIGMEQKVALFAGKLVDFKRPLDVIEAAAIVRQQSSAIHVVVAGSGHLEAEMRACAAQRNVPLDILGFQNQSKMSAAYSAADVLVLPSTGRETWGLVCNEALASGRPIIISDAVGCAPDLAADGRVGRTFPAGDVGALAGALAETFASPPSRHAIQEVSDRYSLAIAAAGIVEAAKGAKARIGKP
jgi:glycosyltransferase involved in cell wall biosynthesis